MLAGCKGWANPPPGPAQAPPGPPGNLLGFAFGHRACNSQGERREQDGVETPGRPRKGSKGWAKPPPGPFLDSPEPRTLAPPCVSPLGLQFPVGLRFSRGRNKAAWAGAGKAARVGLIPLPDLLGTSRTFLRSARHAIALSCGLRLRQQGLGLRRQQGLG